VEAVDNAFGSTCDVEDTEAVKAVVEVDCDDDSIHSFQG